MRLTEHEVTAIKQAAREAFGDDAVVRLFGSRLDDTRRGGDIDLHVSLDDEPSPLALARFRHLLEREVGERDYDVVTSTSGRTASPVAAKAMREGCVL